MDYFCSKKDAAGFFKVSVQALDGWFTAGCPVQDRDDSGRIRSVSLQDMHEWRLSRASEGGELERERTRLTKAQADKTELEVSEIRGESARMPVIVQHWQAMVSSMRAKLLALPSKGAATIAPADKVQFATDALQALVHEALSEIANDAIPHEIRARIDAQRRANDADDSEATAEVDFESMGE